MKPEDKIVGEVESIADDILEHEAMELVDVEYRKESNGWVLRVLIDKNGGVTTDDCRRVSRQLSDILDVKSIMCYAYKLEVSSPGLNRPLRKEKDFKRFIGETVKLKTCRPIESRRNFVGRLVDYKDGSIFLYIDGRNFTISHDIIIKANLEYDFNKDKIANKGKKCFQN
jgi:ribosome maturation factor RimP